MITWQKGVVTRILSDTGQLQELEVTLSDGTSGRALHYLDHNPPAEVHDHVRLNTTAVELKLGTGGWHFVHSIEGKMPILPQPNEHGHIMKLRYTSSQHAVHAVEEQSERYGHAFAEGSKLGGMPVVIGELHSMVPIAFAWWSMPRAERSMRASYIMTDGAALPIAFSSHVRELKRLGWMDRTITCGHAYGGELEAINVYTALLAVKHVSQADAAMIAMGPGIVGTGTVWGHTAVDIAEAVHATRTLGGVPIVIPRISFADPRERHRGISHHILTVLGQATFAPAIVPMPAQLTGEQRAILHSQLDRWDIPRRHEVVWVDDVSLEQVETAFKRYPPGVTTMGRGLSEDAPFFLAVCCAAETARRMIL